MENSINALNIQLKREIESIIGSIQNELNNLNISVGIVNTIEGNIQPGKRVTVKANPVFFVEDSILPIHLLQKNTQYFVAQLMLMLNVQNAHPKMSDAENSLHLQIQEGAKKLLLAIHKAKKTSGDKIYKMNNNSLHQISLSQKTLLNNFDILSEALSSSNITVADFQETLASLLNPTQVEKSDLLIQLHKILKKEFNRYSNEIFALKNFVITHENISRILKNPQITSIIEKILKNYKNPEHLSYSDLFLQQCQNQMRFTNAQLQSFLTQQGLSSEVQAFQNILSRQTSFQKMLEIMDTSTKNLEEILKNWRIIKNLMKNLCIPIIHEDIESFFTNGHSQPLKITNDSSRNMKKKK